MRKSIDREGFAARLARAIERAPLNRTEIAKELSEFEDLGTKPGRISEWTATVKPSLPDGRVMLLLPGILGVSGHWLLTGQGPMIPDEEDVDAARYRVVKQVVEALDSDWMTEGIALALEQLAEEGPRDPPE